MCLAFIVVLLENSKLFYILLLFCLHIKILAVSGLFKCLIAKSSGDTPDFFLLVSFPTNIQNWNMLLTGEEFYESVRERNANHFFRNSCRSKLQKENVFKFCIHALKNLRRI